MLFWLSSRAALPGLRSGSTRSSGAAGGRLLALANEIEAVGPESVGRALDAEITRRAGAYLTGLEAYRRHPFRRPREAMPVAWHQGTTRLIDFAPDSTGPAVLVVPSLINRWYILDLLPERSFLRHLASQGLRPLVVDWGVPGRLERGFDLDDYIAVRLDAALCAAADLCRAPLALIGYCMGGLLALALALRQPSKVARLVLLATPWDFHAEEAAQAQFLGAIGETLPALVGACGAVPVEVIQALFFLRDPFSAERKYIRFAGLDPRSTAARDFVALEDWINDGVPLPSPVMQECLRSWYGENEPPRGLWEVAGNPIRPEELRQPALVVVPRADHIVPPSSAEPLAAALGTADMLRPPLGHVGMMAAPRAPDLLWTLIAQWLRR
ncbi:MAG TPA: alpha/beta fold hydrolase [Stellaceae bacterium]